MLHGKGEGAYTNFVGALWSLGGACGVVGFVVCCVCLVVLMDSPRGIGGLFKSPFNCVIFPLTQPQVANQQQQKNNNNKFFGVLEAKLLTDLS